MKTKNVLFVLLLFVVPACGSPQTIPTPTPQPSPFPTSTITSTATPWYQLSDPLIRVMVRGGLCPYGMCWREYAFFQDGRYTFTEGGGETREGLIEEDDLTAVRNEVELADFDRIRSVPFTDICPTAYDGSESIYTFFTPHGEEMISSCEYMVDGEWGMFELVFELIENLN